MLGAARICVPGQSSTRVLSLPAWEGWRWPREPRVGAAGVRGSKPPRLGGWGGRRCWILGEVSTVLLRVEHVELHLHLFCCVSRSSVELCGAGEQGRDDTSPNPL